MATTTQSYTGDGVKGVAGQTQLTFDFPYIKQSDVKVSLNGVTLDTTKYTFPTATSIQFNAGTATSTQEASGAPKSGVDILFYRQTDVDSAKAIFATGSGIRAKDLNNNIDQALFALQEVQDIVRSEEIEDSAITSAKIKDDSIVNADINASAAIAQSKLDIANATQSAAGYQSAADKTKLDGIETGATADQTAAEIRTLVESATDSNVFTDADHTKLDGIESNATQDQTASEIKTLYEDSGNDNKSYIKTTYESNSDTNAFTDAEKTKLGNLGSLNALSDVDTGGVSDNKILKYDSSVSKFIIADDGGGGAGGGSSTFTGLSDSPSNYGSAAGKVLKVNSGETALEFSDADVIADTTPQLGGDLDVQTNAITTSTTNGNIKLTPAGTGKIEVQGNGTSNVGTLRLNNHNNSAGVNLKSHNTSADYDVTLFDQDPAYLQYASFVKIDSTGQLSIDNRLLHENGTHLNMGAADITFGNTGGIYFDSATPNTGTNNGKIGFFGSTTIPNDVNFVVPNADGASGTFLKTNGSGALTFGSTMYEYTTGSNTYGWAAGDIIFNGPDTSGDGTISGDEVLHWDKSAMTLDMGKYGAYANGFGRWITKNNASSGDEIANNGTIFQNIGSGLETGIFSYGTISIGASDNSGTQLARFKPAGAPGGNVGTVELNYVSNPYFGNKSSVKRLETHATGVTVTGTLAATDGFIGVDAGATGSGNDKIFWENGQTITTSYTIGTTFGAACNAMSAGPITINDSVGVTVDDGDTWTIV